MDGETKSEKDVATIITASDDNGVPETIKLDDGGVEPQTSAIGGGDSVIDLDCETTTGGDGLRKLGADVGGVSGGGVDGRKNAKKQVQIDDTYYSNSTTDDDTDRQSANDACRRVKIKTKKLSATRGRRRNRSDGSCDRKKHRHSKSCRPTMASSYCSRPRRCRGRDASDDDDDYEMSSDDSDVDVVAASIKRSRSKRRRPGDTFASVAGRRTVPSSLTTRQRSYVKRR